MRTFNQFVSQKMCKWQNKKNVGIKQINDPHNVKPIIVPFLPHKVLR